MEADRPLRKDAERNRQRILAAARDLFATRGLEPNLNDIAHHAGVGVGTIYRRFSTKEELLEALFEDAMHQLADLAEEALRQPDSWQGFSWYMERMCEMTATDRGLNSGSRGWRVARRTSDALSGASDGAMGRMAVVMFAVCRRIGRPELAMGQRAA